MSGGSPHGVTAERWGAAAREQVARPQAWLYCSFADGFGGGNPAGVVLSPASLSDAVAQAIAAIVGAPTTGFLVAPEPGADAVAVRFFTPEREIDACGHVTIAVATALVDHGIWTWGDDVIVRARGGEFPLRLRDGTTEMTQRLRRPLEPVGIGWEDVTAAVGPAARQTSLPLAVAATGLRHLIVPLASVDALAALELDAGRVAALARAAGVDTVCVWAPTACTGRVRMRELCAAIGALEEPASGTTAAALALYLRANDHLDVPELVIEQGVEMGHPSRIDVTVDAPDTATVRGSARKFLSGPVELWNDDGP
jgi:trans-2,3-dihydro-3-hydroxyanthranilate isomerase